MDAQTVMPDDIQRQALAQLERAERNGLRLAIACRTAVIAIFLVWYVGSLTFSSGIEPRLTIILMLGLFTGFGVAHLFVIGTRFDHVWMKYAIYAADISAICVLFATLPISSIDGVPQILAFRAYGIYYLFPVIAMACLSLSWGLVIWSGLVVVVGWWGAFLSVIKDMPVTLSWGDMPAPATTEDYRTIFLSLDFIGQGNRIEETVFLFLSSLILALAVYRARQVLLSQVAATIGQARERAARERISDTLGRYVPATVADMLINNPAALEPHTRHASVLIMDIAGFTEFASRHSPDEVIRSLDAFLSEASDTIGHHEGVVITFTGDGLLAIFNAPVDIDDPEQAAARAARELVALSGRSGFGIRIGIASGPIVLGIIGSSTRQAFTVYGDTVNLASRLEGLAKQEGETILMDEATTNNLGPDQVSSELGARTIRGIQRPVAVSALR